MDEMASGPHAMASGPHAIKVGDRVTWEQRPAHRTPLGTLVPAKMLTGIVRSFNRADEGDVYAVVATDPDGRITQPAVDRLMKAEPS
jgi:hypothetical protein